MDKKPTVNNNPKKKMNLIEEWVGDMIYGNAEKNIEGAIAKGYSEEKMLKLKEEWIKFGEYCFNRSHSVAYAKISLMTAYLKCYYPVEFMAALLTISEGKKDKHGKPKNIHYMKECENMGIEILPPDINESLSEWTPVVEEGMKADELPNFDEACLADPSLIEVTQDRKAIRYGLSSIGKVSGESVNEIIRHRPYTSVEDLVEKTNGTKVNKTKVEALIKSGSFDRINNNRNLLLRNYFMSRHEDYEHISTQTSKAAILSYEKECFGTTVSIRSRWAKIEEGSQTQITGYIRSIEPWTAKSSGKKHYTIEVETQEEPIEATLWGYLFERYGDAVKLGNKVTFKGEKSREKLTVKTVQLQEDTNN